MWSRVVGVLSLRWVKQLGVVVWFCMVATLIYISVDPAPFLEFGYWGVFAFNLFGPGTVLIPILAPRMNLLALACVGSLGMTINDSVSFLVGREGDVILPKSVRRYHLLELVERTHPYKTMMVLMGLAVVPVPFDVLGLVSGYVGLRYRYFFFASLVGKWLRFFIFGALVVWLEFDVVEWLGRVL